MHLFDSASVPLWIMRPQSHPLVFFLSSLLIYLLLKSWSVEGGKREQSSTLITVVLKYRAPPESLARPTSDCFVDCFKKNELWHKKINKTVVAMSISYIIV